VPGGTQLQRLQQVPQALWQRRGRDDKRHLAPHAPLQSEHQKNCKLVNKKIELSVNFKMSQFKNFEPI